MNAAPFYPLVQAPRSARSGLVYLRDQTAQYFLDYNINAVVPPVGLKYRSFTLNQATPANSNRVVFIPGEFDGENILKSRNYGVISRDIRNSASVVNPSEIAAWERPFTVSIWAAPKPGESDDEQSAISEVENLLELTIRAMLSALDPSDPRQGKTVAASIVWGNVLIKSPPSEKAFGTELLLSAIQLCPIFGLTLDVVQPSAVVPRTGA
jgi:hypothetical protein